MTATLLTIADRLTLVPTQEDKMALLGRLAPSSLTGPLRLAFVNAHAANLCHKDPAFLKDLLACDMILRDGAGMKMLYKFLRRDAGINLNGTDFIPELLTLYKEEAVALFGTQDPYLGNAAQILKNQGYKIVASIDGFQPKTAYLDLARQSRPSLIVLAMGMPLQEEIAAYLAQNLTHPCLIVCGGAILDFIGGKVRRAPLLFRKLGLEWFFRLIIEPKRLFGRYVIGNVLFISRAWCAASCVKRAKN